jgi:hypothetical protein
MFARNICFEEHDAAYAASKEMSNDTISENVGIDMNGLLRFM